MSPQKNPSSPKEWETKELVVKSIPSESTQVRNIIIGISTAVALTLAWVGGYAWYVSEQNKEAAVKALRAKKKAIAVAIQTQEKTPKRALTKEEKEFIQHSKKLTLSDDGEVILLTAFAPAKKIEPKETPKKDVPVKKDTSIAHAIEKSPAKRETAKETASPPSALIWPDGRLRLTGKPGEAEALRKILESAWDPSAREKSKK